MHDHLGNTINWWVLKLFSCLLNHFGQNPPKTFPISIPIEDLSYVSSLTTTVSFPYVKPHKSIFLLWFLIMLHIKLLSNIHL